MSVIIETSLGDLEVDIFEECPLAAKNFIKLAKAKYYNGLRFYEIHKNFLARTGDPSHAGKGGCSIYGLLDIFESMDEKPKFLKDIDYQKQISTPKRYFQDEINKDRKHNKKGLLATSNKGPNMNESGFYITLTDEHAQYLDGKHTIFGQVIEGEEVLDSINDAYLMNKDGLSIEDKGEPYQAIKIKHILIIDDPFDNPSGLRTPSRSPSPAKNLEDDEEAKYVNDDIDLKKLLAMTEGGSEEEVNKYTAKKIAKSQAHVLEILGDLPEAEIEPPKNVLFVCKLNPVTQEADLEAIFSRFGEIKSCNVVRDWKTGESLQYAFIEFESEEACNNAYLKMDNVNIDERRIHVDFSQSVATLWAPYKKKQFQEAAKELFKEYELQKDAKNEGNREEKGRHKDNDDRHRRHKHERHYRDRDDRRGRDDRRDRDRHRSDRHKRDKRESSRDRDRRRREKHKRRDRSDSRERSRKHEHKRKRHDE